MQLTNLTFHTLKGIGFLALMFVTDEFVSCERLWRIQPKESGSRNGGAAKLDEEQEKFHMNKIHIAKDSFRSFRSMKAK
ncbi:hypothetical protein [Geobacillus sp. BMUD]|uniref:hypothetical protein n=1 Tax=Geobacillus sp. BMUD TaxID=2508876 RepID=UPI00209C270F|nr:hypothetical protein [Geobacillus sp. BMUD]